MTPRLGGRFANALTKKRMYAKDASFGDDLAQAYGIEWVEDLFAPADQDGRYTTNVEGFLGAQHEWMTNNLPKKGAIVDVNSWGQPEHAEEGVLRSTASRPSPTTLRCTSIAMARCRLSIIACPRWRSQ